MSDFIYKLGKLPATYDNRDIRWTNLKQDSSAIHQKAKSICEIRDDAALPSIPNPHGGYGTEFPGGVWPGWGMYANGPCDDNTIPSSWYAYNGVGCCAWSGPGHETMTTDKNGGRTVAKFTCLNIANQYAEYLGLKSAQDLSASNDQGSQVRDVLQWRATKGLLDASGQTHKVGVYVALEPTNLQDLWEALWLFECVGIGINFPGSAMDQFNAGQIWSVVNGAQIEGGHYIPLVGHPVSSAWTCVTWGKRQMMTNQFIQTYCDEAWAYITPERYNEVTGDTLQGYNDADLEKFISLVGTAPTS